MKSFGSAMLSTARMCSEYCVSAMKSESRERSLRNAVKLIPIFIAPGKTSGENFCAADPNVFGALGWMSTVIVNDVNSTRSTPFRRMVASTTAIGTSVVATGDVNTGEAPVVSATSWPVPTPETSPIRSPSAAIDSFREPQTKSCASEDWSMSPSYSSRVK
jgi:hypothetical protein